MYGSLHLKNDTEIARNLGPRCKFSEDSKLKRYDRAQ